MNEAASIARVIEALLEDLPEEARVSLVVVDGGSNDGTADIVRGVAASRQSVVLLENPARIQGAAVNLAARVMGQAADVLIRCDAHAQYPQGYIRRLLETLDRTRADAVVVPMDSVGAHGCLHRAIAWVSDTPLGSGGSAHRGGRRSGFVDHGHHAAFRMASFRRCGGYDETFTHNEDAELDCRQRRLGGRIYLDADIRIAYQPRATVAALASQYFRYGRGRSRTVRRHPGSLRMRQVAVPLHVATMLAALALAAWWPLLLLWPLLYLLVLAAGSAHALLRHRCACALLCGPAAGVMHLSWGAGFLAGLVVTRQPAWDGRVCVPCE